MWMGTTLTVHFDSTGTQRFLTAKLFQHNANWTPINSPATLKLHISESYTVWSENHDLLVGTVVGISPNCNNNRCYIMYCFIKSSCITRAVHKT